MRIEHVVTRSFPRGAETTAIELGHELESLGHENEVVALALAFDGDSDPRMPALVQTKSLGPMTMLRGCWKLRKRLAASSPDVVIAHGGWAAQIAAFGSWRSPARLVWQRIGVVHERAWHGVRGIYWRFVARRFDAAIVISPELEREMSRLAYGGPVWTIPNARNPARFDSVDRDEASARLRAELGVQADVFVIGFVGHLAAVKQPELAVDVLDALRRDGCDAHLVIAGDGPLRSSVENRVAERGLQSSVTLLGHRDDIEWIYGALDLLVITSASEGVPGVVIEAQMAGCPTVSFPVGSVAQVIDDRETGVITERADVPSMAKELAALLADAPERLAMSKLGRDRSLRYSMSATALVYQERLQNLVDHPGSE